MADYPYFLELQAVLTANGTATVSQPIPTGESWDIMGLRQQSTGAFVITDIRDSRGVHYTNASASTPIPNDYFQDTASPNLQQSEFPIKLSIPPAIIFYIDLKDTSGGGNTVNLILPVIRHAGS